MECLPVTGFSINILTQHSNITFDSITSITFDIFLLFGEHFQPLSVLILALLTPSLLSCPAVCLPHVGTGSCRIGPIRFLAGWHERPLNQALVLIYFFAPRVRLGARGPTPNFAPPSNISAGFPRLLESPGFFS